MMSLATPSRSPEAFRSIVCDIIAHHGAHHGADCRRKDKLSSHGNRTPSRTPQTKRNALIPASAMELPLPAVQMHSCPCPAGSSAAAHEPEVADMRSCRSKPSHAHHSPCPQLRPRVAASSTRNPGPGPDLRDSTGATRAACRLAVQPGSLRGHGAPDALVTRAAAFLEQHASHASHEPCESTRKSRPYLITLAAIPGGAANLTTLQRRNLSQN